MFSLVFGIQIKFWREYFCGPLATFSGRWVMAAWRPPQRGSGLGLTAPYFIPCRPECVILLPRVGRVKKLRAFAYTYFLVSGLIVLIAVSSLVRHNVLPRVWYLNKILARVFLWTVGDIFGQVGDGRVAPPPKRGSGPGLTAPYFIPCRPECVILLPRVGRVKKLRAFAYTYFLVQMTIHIAASSAVDT
jgi:hypothetical protein